MTEGAQRSKKSHALEGQLSASSKTRVSRKPEWLKMCWCTKYQISFGNPILTQLMVRFFFPEISPLAKNFEIILFNHLSSGSWLPCRRWCIFGSVINRRCGSLSRRWMQHTQDTEARNDDVDKVWKLHIRSVLHARKGNIRRGTESWRMVAMKWSYSYM